MESGYYSTWHMVRAQMLAAINTVILPWHHT